MKIIKMEFTLLCATSKLSRSIVTCKTPNDRTNAKRLSILLKENYFSSLSARINGVCPGHGLFGPRATYCSCSSLRDFQLPLLSTTALRLCLHGTGPEPFRTEPDRLLITRDRSGTCKKAGPVLDPFGSVPDRLRNGPV